MGVLLISAILAIPVLCLWLILRIRDRQHPGGGYGGRYDAPGRMSLMTYAQMGAMTSRHLPSGAGSDVGQIGEGFTETDICDAEDQKRSD